MTDTERYQRAGLPERPSLDGLEEKWARHWQEEGTYTFDRSKERADVYAIDTPPPTVSGELHVGHVFSYTHTDMVARFRRMRGKAVFYPMGWDDNGLPTERRVQNVYGVRCDPTVPYDSDFAVPDTAYDPPVAVSRGNFIELCERLTVEDEKAFETLWRRLGLSVDWSLTYSTIGRDARAASQRAFLRNLGRGEAYAAAAPTLWDVSFSTAVAQAELEDRERQGAYHRLRFHRADEPSGERGGAAGESETQHGSTGEPTDHSRQESVYVETTRPELLPACVALVCHPSDERYAALVGSTVRTPVFGVEVPVYAHPLAQPDKGTGIAMVCTWGDLADVTWWRELSLPTRAVIGRDGRLVADPPAGLDSGAGREAYAKLAGLTVNAARRVVVQMLSESGDLIGEPRPVTHPVKFYERGDKPLEIVASRQWYLRNGGRDLRRAQPEPVFGGGEHAPDSSARAQPEPVFGGGEHAPSSPTLREALLARGRELHWVPEHMRHRYEHWVNGLIGDWLISRQRYLGVPIPVWYRLDDAGQPDYQQPLAPPERRLPVDPADEAPEGFTEADRGQPGGFIADPDVMDTWATSSMSPQIIGGWERDEDLFHRVFPMDLRPQGQEIIRTWLFSSVVRAHLEHGVLPWRDTVISGWILDPDRKKMSKSKGKALTPMGLLDQHGSDAVRYWAACGRPGTDLAFDENQMKVGRRLATKILNASRFVLGLGAAEALRSPVTRPLDRAMLAELSTVAATATSALEGHDHTGALTAAEAFFWTFCDDYIELVKNRAYGTGDDASSAQAALATALSVQLRLFAPFLPFVTAEVWSWWRYGSVHRSPWPSRHELTRVAEGGDGRLLSVVSRALSQVRRAKSERRLSMRTEVPLAEALGPAAELELLAQAADDLRAAGRIGKLDLLPDRTDELVVACAF